VSRHITGSFKYHLVFEHLVIIFAITKPNINPMYSKAMQNVQDFFVLKQKDFTFTNCFLY
jgi:hypothetical protein